MGLPATPAAAGGPQFQAAAPSALFPQFLPLAAALVGVAWGLMLAAARWRQRSNPSFAGCSTDAFHALAVDGQDMDPCRGIRKAVIEYPDQRVFVAIGMHEPGYAAAMAIAAMNVLEINIDVAALDTRPSSNGKYLSVRIGPVEVASEEQVIQVYTALRRDTRTRYIL